MKNVKQYLIDKLARVNLYGTVGVDWNTDPSKVSQSMRDKAKAASKRKVKF